MEIAENTASFVTCFLEAQAVTSKMSLFVAVEVSDVAKIFDFCVI